MRDVIPPDYVYLIQREDGYYLAARIENGEHVYCWSELMHCVQFVDRQRAEQAYLQETVRGEICMVIEIAPS